MIYNFTINDEEISMAVPDSITNEELRVLIRVKAIEYVKASGKADVEYTVLPDGHATNINFAGSLALDG